MFRKKQLFLILMGLLFAACQPTATPVPPTPKVIVVTNAPQIIVVTSTPVPTQTETPTVTPPPFTVFTETPVPAQKQENNSKLQSTETSTTGVDCSPLTSKVSIGGMGFNSAKQDLHPKISPTTSDRNAFILPNGAQFKIMAGPKCGESRTWWQIEYNGKTGWLAEANSNVYNFSPVQ